MIDKIEKIITEVEDIHPYKERGNPESYNDYNQGWADACDILGERIKDELINNYKFFPWLPSWFVILFFILILLSTLGVLTFLTLIIERFEKRPTRAPHLCQWIHAIIKYHTAYLMSLPDLVKNLSSLYQVCKKF